MPVRPIIEDYPVLRVNLPSKNPMHAGALRALEFDRIVEAVCRSALTPQGLRRLRALGPSTDREVVAQALAATAETFRFLVDNSIGLQAGADLEAVLNAIGVEGRPLEPLHLLSLAGFLTSVENTCAGIRRAGAAAPTLRRIADRVASFDAEIVDLRRKIDPAGEVVDDASRELKSVRERLRKQRTRLRGTLESYLRGKDTSKYLQQQIVTDRNGRYVLVVRVGTSVGDPGNRSWQLRQRRKPVSRAAQHGRNQQRHRRARATGSRRSPSHPPRTDRRLPKARRRSGAHGGRGGRTRRAPGARPVLSAGRRRSSQRLRRTAASIAGGKASAAHLCRAAACDVAAIDPDPGTSCPCPSTWS